MGRLEDPGCDESWSGLGPGAQWGGEMDRDCERLVEGLLCSFLELEH